MYGKKRIVLNTRNQIVLLGGKSRINIGIYSKFSTGIDARVLTPDNKFNSQFTSDNCISINNSTKTEIRNKIKTLYNIV